MMQQDMVQLTITVPGHAPIMIEYHREGQIEIERRTHGEIAQYVVHATRFSLTMNKAKASVQTAVGRLARSINTKRT